MSTPPLTTYRRERPRRRRRYAVIRWAVRLLLAAVLFAGGVALGQALDDNPASGPAGTSTRDLKPLPLRPLPDTVTVTVTGS